MGLDILQAGLELGVKIIRLGVGNQPAARAVTAIRGAPVGDQEEDAVRITVDDARDGHGAFLADRVLGFARSDIGFFDARDDLPTDRTVRILGVDQVEEMGRDRQGQLMRGKETTFPLFLGQRQPLLELRKGGDAVAELPVPVVPLRGGHVLPEPLAGMPVFAEVLRIHRLSPLS